MKYIEALSEYYPVNNPLGILPYESSVFLAGGITGCSDWQSELTALLSDTNLVVLNPRRQNFPAKDPLASAQQIRWEHKHLAMASLVSFWFPHETLCPITLFELGTFTMGQRPLLVGCDPKYARRRDIETQMSLYRPDVKVVESIEELSEQIHAFDNWGKVRRKVIVP